MPVKKKVVKKNILKKKGHRFKNGDPKPANSGRKKGVKNKKTVFAENRVNAILTLIENEYLEDDIKNATANTRINLYSDMLEYAMPKMARVDAQGNAVTEIVLKVTRSRKPAQSAEGG